MINPHLLAISEFSKLSNAALIRKEEDCFNKYLHIRIENGDNIYIGFSFVLSDSAILCEVNDKFGLLDNSKVLPNEAIIQYIGKLGKIMEVKVGTHKIQ